jgi:hypothetical protein
VASRFGVEGIGHRVLARLEVPVALFFEL